MPSKTIIEAENLTAGYGNKVIWKDAEFKVESGEFIALLGPNGAGKTTMIRLLLGLIKPHSGRINLLGKAPKRGNPEIGYIPQRHFIDSETRIEAIEFVMFGGSGVKWGISLPKEKASEREAAYEALKAVGATELAHRKLGELSGGEMQRIFLAQALVGNPKLLLLDEPLANMDIRRETELIRLVSEISKSKNLAVLLIAHDINPLLPYVDRIIYVVNGRVATGKVNEIITDKKLSELYDSPIEVLHDSKGRVAVLGTEEAAHHE